LNAGHFIEAVIVAEVVFFEKRVNEGTAVAAKEKPISTRRCVSTIVTAMIALMGHVLNLLHF
jgi:hypothetical protein